MLETGNEGYQTNKTGKFNKNQIEVGHWPDNHPKNPKNLIINIALSFGDYLAQGLSMTDQTAQETPKPSAQINIGDGLIPKGKKKETDHEESESRGLRGKPPNIFDGDRTKSKAFISDIKIYFNINLKKTEIKNCYIRVFLMLSFIKGLNVVN